MKRVFSYPSVSLSINKVWTGSFSNHFINLVNKICVLYILEYPPLLCLHGFNWKYLRLITTLVIKALSCSTIFFLCTFTKNYLNSFSLCCYLLLSLPFAYFVYVYGKIILKFLYISNLKNSNENNAISSCTLQSV